MNLSRRKFIAALGVTGVVALTPGIAIAGPDYTKESIQAAMGVSPLPSVKGHIVPLTEIIAKQVESILGSVKCVASCDTRDARIGSQFLYTLQQWPHPVRRVGNLTNIATASWDGEPTEHYIKKSTEGIAEEIRFRGMKGFICGEMELAPLMPLLESSCNCTTDGGLIVRGLKLYDSHYNQHTYRFDVLYGVA